MIQVVDIFTFKYYSNILGSHEGGLALFPLETEIALKICLIKKLEDRILPTCELIWFSKLVSLHYVNRPESSHLELDQDLCSLQSLKHTNWSIFSRQANMYLV